MTTLESYCFKIYREIYDREYSLRARKWLTRFTDASVQKSIEWGISAQDEAQKQSYDRVVQDFPLIDPNLISETIRKIHSEWDSDIIIVD